LNAIILPCTSHLNLSEESSSLLENHKQRHCSSKHIS
jgi:hypothetical protein